MTTIASNDESVAQTYECSECNKELPTEHGLSVHKGMVHFDTQPVPFSVSNGYEYWLHTHEGNCDMVGVHQLLAISEGEDPHRVFSPDTDVHHTPIEHKRANLPDNVKTLDNSDHTRHHRTISDDSLLSDLSRLADELGHSPTQREINEHGKYSYGSYLNHFGGIETARREAGLLEKSEDVKIDISHLQEKEDTPTVDISHLEQKEDTPTVDISHLEQKEQDMTVDISHLQQEKSVVDVSHLE